MAEKSIDGSSLMGEKVTCHECGKIEKLSWFHEINQKLHDQKLCFNCNFWTELIAVKDDPNTVRASNMYGEPHHYIIGPVTTGSLRWLGYGGNKFIIGFFDGRNVETRNLWHQGEIPEHFQERLPLNAEFVPTARENVLTPAPKAKEIEDLLTSQSGISRQEAFEKKICVWCKKEVGGFRNEISIKEYRISGFCQQCQDDTFGKD